MIDLFILILLSIFLASIISKYGKKHGSVYTACKKDYFCFLLFLILLISLSLFSGLRTSYNDTPAYIHGFNIADISEFNFTLLIQPYGGFEFLQLFIKKYISDNSQIFLLITSLFVNSLFLWFFSKYSKNFVLTIFCYFIIGPYLFSMAGIKQILSMSISLLAIDSLLNKKNKAFMFFIIVAMLFHPYIVCLLILPWFKTNVWKSKMFFLCLFVIIFVSNIENVLLIASLIGKDYSIDELVGNTINPFRVVIELFPVFLSFLARKVINKQNNKLLNLGVNMICVNGLMIFMGLFLNPIYFGRIGAYFACISAVVMPFMFDIIIKNNQNKKINLLLIYSIFSVYFLLDLTKLGTISITSDLFNHVSLFSLF